MLKDRDAMGPTAASPCPSSGGGEPAICGGCGGRITDRYYLLAVDRQWHSTCLKCCECKLALDSELTCFARDGNIYCKEDYYRLFAVKRCGRCQAGISASELVMRARDLVYHLHCFTCASCGVALAKGDHFGMRDGLVYCRPHYELLYHHHHHDPASAAAAAAYCGSGASTIELEAVFRAAAEGSPAAHHYFGNGASAGSGGGTSVQKGRPRKRKLTPSVDSTELPVAMRIPAAALEVLHTGELSSSMDSLGYDSAVASPGNPGQQQRTKRMRTSFKHHQLRTMKSYFAINQNPDAKDLKQLAQKTGLSKRVLQVWFQNARAKWRRNLMRQESGQTTGTGHTSASGGSAGGGGAGGPPSVGSASVIMGDSNSLPPQPTPEDLHHQHHHHHAQTTQTLSFGDLY